MDCNGRLALRAFATLLGRSYLDNWGLGTVSYRLTHGDNIHWLISRRTGFLISGSTLRVSLELFFRITFFYFPLRDAFLETAAAGVVLAEEAPLDLACVAEAFLVLDLALLIFSIFSLKYLNYND